MEVVMVVQANMEASASTEPLPLQEAPLPEVLNPWEHSICRRNSNYRGGGGVQVVVVVVVGEDLVLSCARAGD